MEIVVPFVVQAIAGGAAANVVGQMARALDLGIVFNSVVGAVGGLVGVWLAGQAPALDSLVGSGPGEARVDPGALAGQATVALLCGAALVALVGLAKYLLAKRSGLR